MRRVLAAALLLALVAPAGADEAEPPAWAKALRLRGRLAEEFAYRLHDPGDVSKLKTLGWLDGKYAFSESVAVRAAVRGWYDAVFEATDRYPANVERDQKTDLSLCEALLIVGLGDLDVRLGRQQIVWGEAISTFVHARKSVGFTTPVTNVLIASPHTIGGRPSLTARPPSPALSSASRSERSVFWSRSTLAG